MIKYFQKLKAKKGFTLVELIVVIAIIGVLAAILIPTMLGYVTSSRVTSADSTAASIKNNIDAWLTECDTNGYGMLRGTNTLDITISCTGAQAWSIGSDASVNSNVKSGGKGWGGAVEAITSASSKSTVSTNEGVLGVTIRDLFPEVKQAYAWAHCVGGKCVAVYYTADSSTAPSEDSALTANASNTGWTTAYAWDGSTAGVGGTSGMIIGTAPKLSIV